MALINPGDKMIFIPDALVSFWASLGLSLHLCLTYTCKNTFIHTYKALSTWLSQLAELNTQVLVVATAVAM